MPRIFAPNEGVNTNAGTVDFVNGAAAVAVTETEAIALFTAAGCDIDTNKHALTALDVLPRATLDAISLYLGVALTPGDGKYDVVRDIENSISTKYLGALTVASAAHASELTKTTITIAEAVGAGNTYYYKIAAAAPAPLYGDYIDSSWASCTSPLHVVSTTGLHVTVVRAVTATGFILASGTDNVTCKDA